MIDKHLGEKHGAITIIAKSIKKCPKSAAKSKHTMAKALSNKTISSSKHHEFEFFSPTATTICAPTNLKI